MNIDEEIKKYQLSDEEFEKNADRIFNLWAMNAKISKNPKFVMVGGQAGAGKTGLVINKILEMEEGAIVIDQDEIRAAFPKKLYDEILREHDDREEYLILKPYVLKTRQMLVDKARENGYNVIMESAMQAVDSFIPQIQSFKSAGYKTELSVISVPQVDCYLSTLNRYCYYLEKDGFCRRNTKMDPEMKIRLYSNLSKLEQTGLFDNIEVFIRGSSKDEIPLKVYSKNDNTGETPINAMKRGEEISQRSTRKNFGDRTNAIRQILIDHGEQEKLEQLRKIEEEFKNMDDRRDYGE